MISNSDHLENKQNQCRTALVSAILGCALSAMSAVASAQEGEEFAIKQDSGIQDDGGSEPLTGVANGIPYSVIQGFAVAQGDMVLGEITADGTLALPLVARGVGQAGAFERWPDGIIPYQFAPDVSQLQRDRAQEAIAHWNTHTTLKLVTRDSSNEAEYDNYLSFQTSFGCASYVGRQGGEQEIWLADTCTVGSIIHELGHAIGLFHEHTRVDRDDFVSVNLSNVTTGKEINFAKVDAGAATFSDYDYGSIMHYGEFFFSSNGERSITVPDGILVGQRDALSDKDIASVNDMYATDLKLAVSTEQSDANTRIDLVVSNIGALGANTLRLTTRMGDDADWLSVSANSGWDCLQFGAELRCTRSTLIEQSDTSFSLLVNPNSASIDDLQVRVESKTKDQDESNNVFNDSLDAELASTTTEQAPLSTDDSGEPNTAPEANNTNDTIAGIPDNTTDTDVPAVGAANSGESSGGGAGFYLLLLAFVGRIARPLTKLVR